LQVDAGGCDYSRCVVGKHSLTRLVIAWKAQNRLHKRYMTLMARGKEQRKTMTAIARERLGFIWAIGIKAEAACKQQMAA
jgi:hypothetical protein